jgi:hypothetical protein
MLETDRMDGIAPMDELDYASHEFSAQLGLTFYIFYIQNFV